MPKGLVRYQSEGDDHWITFSCYHRLPYLGSPESRDLFEDSLEQTRKKYEFEVLGYVVMPEHVHMLLSEPSNAPLKTAIQALKLSVSRRSKQRPFWLPRYYDFNITTRDKLVEKLGYMHINPVRRGLVEHSTDWKWSSKNFYMNGTQNIVSLTHIDQQYLK